jgi:hypothetical protein
VDGCPIEFGDSCPGVAAPELPPKSRAYEVGLQERLKDPEYAAAFYAGDEPSPKPRFSVSAERLEEIIERLYEIMPNPGPAIRTLQAIEALRTLAKEMKEIKDAE